MLRFDLIVPGGRRGRRPQPVAIAKYRAAIAALKPPKSKPQPSMRARGRFMSKAEKIRLARAVHRRAFLLRGMEPPRGDIQSRAQEFYMGR